MRTRLVVAALLALAGCSKAPDGDLPDVSGNASAGVAFTYGYAFELPSRLIADLQETHAQACEQAGVATCRITGLSYSVDRDGGAHASLSVKVASRVARRFGRAATVSAERLGATLVGAEISGEEVQPQAAQAGAAQQTADVAAIDRQLADARLSTAERAELRSQRAERVETARDQTASAASDQERLANTPMSFSYQAGHGVGFGNALRDAADTALASTRGTAIWAVWLLAALGPPLVLLALLLLAWRRWGRPAWLRAGRTPAD